MRNILEMALALPDPWSREVTTDAERGWSPSVNHRHVPDVSAGFAGIPTHPKVERVIRALAPRIIHAGHIENPHYSPGEDAIYFPFPESFLSPTLYARTLVHEVSHWTALHDVERRNSLPTMLDGLIGNMTSTGQEELTAELAVYLSSDLLELGEETQGHSLHYIRAWLDNIADHRNTGDRDPRRAFNLALPNARRIVEFYRSKLS